MVNVNGSKGGVNVNIKGVADTIKNLDKEQFQLINAIEASVIQAATFVNGEVQESIIGNRAEPRSVSTGQLGNSIETKKEGKMRYVVQVDGSTYSNGTPVSEVALFLEKGTRHISPRYHFQNTHARVENDVVDIIKGSISFVTKF